jgi:hypothetical protein
MGDSTQRTIKEKANELLADEYVSAACPSGLFNFDEYCALVEVSASATARAAEGAF